MLIKILEKHKLEIGESNKTMDNVRTVNVSLCWDLDPFFGFTLTL